MSFLLQCIFLFVAVSAIGSSSPDGPIVDTDTGKIQGFQDKSSKGRSFYTYHKIPFAEPPIGKLRFKDPKAVTKWAGIINGSQEQVSCPCPDNLIYLKDKTLSYDGQEDCLYLSVYTSKIPQDEELLPVLVFIHGGGFLSGSNKLYEGNYLMNEDIVFVSINYRVGVLGFLTTEDDVMPGNLGLKDQTIALKWIKNNVKYFGGDPSRITLAGSSAGSASVHFQILTPESKGLFSKAILQSGTALNQWTHAENLRSVAYQVGASLGCFAPANIGEKQSERLLKCLQEIDAEELTMVFDKLMTWNFLPNVLTPYVDGKYLPDQPEILVKEGRYNHVDMIIGVTKDDGAWVTESLYSKNDQIELLEKDFDYYGPISLGLNYENSSEILAKKVYNYYLGKLEVSRENADAVTEMHGDVHFKVASDIVALMHSENERQSGGKTYFYELDYKGQYSLLDEYQIEFGMHWINHADELFLMFPFKFLSGTADRTENDAHVGGLFTKLWANFVATGDPTPDDSLGFTWEPFTKDCPSHLSIKMQPEMKEDGRKEIREFWSSLPTRTNMWLYGAKGARSAKSKL